jgi:hypothetical protein
MAEVAVDAAAMAQPVETDDADASFVPRPTTNAPILRRRGNSYARN